MKKTLARGVLALVAVGVCAVGMVAVTTPVAADNCEAKCQREYRQCVPFCSKNPCFVSCETVLEICLSNCGVTQ